MAWCLTAPSHYLNQCWLSNKDTWKGRKSLILDQKRAPHLNCVLVNTDDECYQRFRYTARQSMWRLSEHHLPPHGRSQMTASQTAAGQDNPHYQPSLDSASAAIDSSTISMHNPNDRQYVLFSVEVVQGSVIGLRKTSYVPTMHCSQFSQPRIWCCHYLPPGSLHTLGHPSLFHTVACVSYELI